MNKIEEQFSIPFKELGYELVDLKKNPIKFQNFLNTVSDFFIERQGNAASADEAQNIIDNLPLNTPEKDKLLFGIQQHNQLIGFFEILLNFPSQAILASEAVSTKKLLGQLNAPRFTITFLVLHSEHRNKGLGKIILLLIEKILKENGLQYSHLVVNESNIKAEIPG